ncbi:MAG: PTS sugar transporter subunit IIA [Syntrophorhabdaceae bacterium]|nr:PTS sugar transporter subunit IIA [Syntrophorhabdaceae bacterium]
MRILDLIPAAGVIDALGSETKDGVLQELSEAICRALPGMSPDHLLSVLMERESLGSTGIGGGIAIPHGKMPGIDRLIVVFGRSLDGVQFASLDGRPAHFFFLVVAPEDNSAGTHLKVLARISRLAKNERFRHRLVEAEGAEEIRRVFAEEDEPS